MLFGKNKEMFAKDPVLFKYQPSQGSMPMLKFKKEKFSKNSKDRKKLEIVKVDSKNANMAILQNF